MPTDQSSFSEQDLVAQLRAGDEVAFEALLARYQGKLYRLALSFTKNREDAEEILQDVFLSVYRKVASFDGRSAFGTWLYRIAVNAALMKLRGRGPVQESIEEYLPQFTKGGGHARMIADWSEGPEGSLLGKERAQVVREAIETLPPEHKRSWSCGISKGSRTARWPRLWAPAFPPSRPVFTGRAWPSVGSWSRTCRNSGHANELS
jgi:RNA polymerase sigma-70 factor (ECF subfamily)